MSAGDSAEAFISIRPLRAWEVACVVLWSSVTYSVFRPLGDDRELLSQFPTHQPPNVFLTEA